MVTPHGDGTSGFGPKAGLFQSGEFLLPDIRAVESLASFCTKAQTFGLGFVSQVTTYLVSFGSASEEQGCRKDAIYQGPCHKVAPARFPRGP